MKRETKAVQNLSFAIGDFIRYWGFRRIHGAVWAQIFLSSKPLSCTELCERLEVSKALVSPALEELVKHRVIREVASHNDKVRLYETVDDINTAIQNVLKNREAPMLHSISKLFKNIETLQTDDLDKDKVDELGQMIRSSLVMLELFLQQRDLLNLPRKLGLY